MGFKRRLMIRNAVEEEEVLGVNFVQNDGDKKS
jgi:hypothetical protein